MYLRRVRLRNVKCFEDIELRFESAAETREPQSNWNVILGENGEGKTTLLRAIASCLMDANTATEMVRPTGWVRNEATEAVLEASIVPQDMDRGPAGGRREREVARVIVNEDLDRGIQKPAFVDALDEDAKFLAMSAFRRMHSQGWFSAGYGPFRRPPGTSESLDSKDVFERRFATLFDDKQPLHDCENWLKELERKALKAGETSIQARNFGDVKAVLIRLLPGVEEIRIEDQVTFVWRGQPSQIEHLSQGYRSTFLLIVDILRWMEDARSTARIPMTEVQGIVLIDEVDAHLHPEWQKQIGFTLCKTFPNIQFIVASHSPFVAMAAGKDALTLLARDDNRVVAKQHLPFVRGWTVGRVLSELFGQVSQRDPETEAMLSEYEVLRLKQRRSPLRGKAKERFQVLQEELGKRLAGDQDSLANREMDASLAWFSKVLEERERKADA